MSGFEETKNALNVGIDFNYQIKKSKAIGSDEMICGLRSYLSHCRF